jgi:hypothetical protein
VNFRPPVTRQSVQTDAREDEWYLPRRLELLRAPTAPGQSFCMPQLPRAVGACRSSNLRPPRDQLREKTKIACLLTQCHSKWFPSADGWNNEHFVYARRTFEGAENTPGSFMDSTFSERFLGVNFLGFNFGLGDAAESSSYQRVQSFFASQTLHNRKKIKKKSGRVNDEANFSFFILLHKRANPILSSLPTPSPPRANSKPPYIHPSAHPYLTHRPPIPHTPPTH